MVYADRDTGDLMYAVRDTNGKLVRAVAHRSARQLRAAAGGYQYISLAIDNNGNPGVAYFDGWNGDLKYACIDPTRARIVAGADGRQQGLDRPVSVARLQPQQRAGHQLLQPHDKGDLELAQSQASARSASRTIDTTGDVGRFSSLMLDPNRPTATKWAIGYEDTTNGNYKYAIQGLFDGGTQVNGYTNYIVDDLSDAGGYVSLAFYDSGTNDSKRYKPAMSYYDASQSGLRYAKSHRRRRDMVSRSTVATKDSRACTRSSSSTTAGQANIFFFDRTNNEARSGRS